jgi:hypothetical protein
MRLHNALPACQAQGREEAAIAMAGAQPNLIIIGKRQRVKRKIEIMFRCFGVRTNKTTPCGRVVLLVLEGRRDISD